MPVGGKPARAEHRRVVVQLEGQGGDIGFDQATGAAGENTEGSFAGLGAIDFEGHVRFTEQRLARRKRSGVDRGELGVP